MSQLARRENAPHRAAFVTSLSRWYIRRLLGNLPPFHPCLSAERRPRIAPCGTSSPYGHILWKSRDNNQYSNGRRFDLEPSFSSVYSIGLSCPNKVTYSSIHGADFSYYGCSL